MEYRKTFPDVMAGKKILYVHGFCSSGQSGTVHLLRTLLPNTVVIAPDLPLHPEEAMTLLRETCAIEKPDLVIGSSMGGIYAEMLYGFDRILVNPAFEMGDTMTHHGMLGKQQFLNPRRDGVQEFIVTKALVKEYKEITEQCFAKVDEVERQRVTGLFGDKDPLVDTFELFNSHYPNALHFHGAHQLLDRVAVHYLVPVIRQIDDRQEKRERPVVYISPTALRNEAGKARPSMYKAYEALLEHYRVYLVAPAPTNHHAAIGEFQCWTEEALSTPAHDHIVFTNCRSLLYGDYLIDTTPCTEFLGTVLLLGSDTFKTWDDLIVYFERLGGQ